MPSKPTTTEPKQCPKLGRYAIVNQNSGEVVQLPCKTYACPVCGPKKAYKLQKAIEDRLDLMDKVRLVTFTVRTTAFAHPKHCVMLIGEIWRRFINNLRRDPRLSKPQKNFQYIKVVEFTKKMFPHFHVFVDKYIPWLIIQYHWNNAINKVAKDKGKNGHVNVKHICSKKNASRYVAKYVLKTAQEFDEKIGKLYGQDRKKLKLYTKSGGMKLFYESESIDPWIFVILEQDCKQSPLTCNELGATSRNIPLQDLNLPPPDAENKEFNSLQELIKHFDELPPITDEDFRQDPYSERNLYE